MPQRPITVYSSTASERGPSVISYVDYPDSSNTSASGSRNLSRTSSDSSWQDLGADESSIDPSDSASGPRGASRGRHQHHHRPIAVPELPSSHRDSSRRARAATEEFHQPRRRRPTIVTEEPAVHYHHPSIDPRQGDPREIFQSHRAVSGGSASSLASPQYDDGDYGHPAQPRFHGHHHHPVGFPPSITTQGSYEPPYPPQHMVSHYGGHAPHDPYRGEGDPFASQGDANPFSRQPPPHTQYSREANVPLAPTPHQGHRPPPQPRPQSYGGYGPMPVHGHEMAMQHHPYMQPQMQPQMMPYGQQYSPWGMPPGMPPNMAPNMGMQVPGYQMTPYGWMPTPQAQIAPPPAPTPAPKAADPPKDDKKNAELEKILAKITEDKEKIKKKDEVTVEEIALLKRNLQITQEEYAKSKKSYEAEKAKEAADKAAAELRAAEEKKKQEAIADATKKAKEEAEKKAKEAADKVKEEADKKLAEQTKKAEEQEKKAKALEEEKKKAAPPPDTLLKPIRFKDAVGRKFTFPWVHAKTWKGMESLILQAFAHVDNIGDHVKNGRYDLSGPDNETILPQVWESVVKPDDEITMHLWPLPEDKKKKDAEAAAAKAKAEQAAQAAANPYGNLGGFGLGRGMQGMPAGMNMGAGGGAFGMGGLGGAGAGMGGASTSGQLAALAAQMKANGADPLEIQRRMQRLSMQQAQAQAQAQGKGKIPVPPPAPGAPGMMADPLAQFGTGGLGGLGGGGFAGGSGAAAEYQRQMQAAMAAGLIPKEKKASSSSKSKSKSKPAPAGLFGFGLGRPAPAKSSKKK